MACDRRWTDSGWVGMGRFGVENGILTPIPLLIISPEHSGYSPVCSRKAKGLTLLMTHREGMSQFGIRIGKVAWARNLGLG